MEEDDEEIKKEKEKLKAFIRQAEGWQMDASAAIQKLKELEAKKPAKVQIAATAAAKDLLGEKTRTIKEHEEKRKTLTEKGKRSDKRMREASRSRSRHTDFGM